MSRHLLSSLLAAALASAPALLAQEAGQRDPHKAGQSQTQDRSETGQRDRDQTGQTQTQDRTGTGQRDRDQTGQSQTQDRTGTATRDRAGAGEQATGTAQLRNNERQFLMNASQDSLMEIELGKVAQERGSSSEVKEFGERMVEEHGKALEKSKSLASEIGVTVAEDLQAKNKTTVDRFTKMSGEEFDRAYMQHMVREHKKAVNLFERTSRNARNAEVKNYASETLPKLRDHLEQAQQLHMQVSSKGTASRQRDPGQTDDQGAAGTKRDEDKKRDQQDPTRTPDTPGTP